MDITKTLKTIADLVAENQAETENRTPHLDVALGGLRSASEQLVNHGKALERIAKEKRESLAKRKEELAKEEAALPPVKNAAAKTA